MKRGLLLLLLAGAAACSNAPRHSSGESYRRGIAAFAAGEPRTARIELMNAIQADPANGRARIMQARVYLQLGDGAAAESELLQAREIGIPAEETRHLLAHAYLLQDEPRKALDEAAAAPARHLRYAARMQGRAQLALGDHDAAAAAFNRALAAAPDDGALWIDIARLRRASGDLAGAIEAADRALVIAPRSAEALSLRGELTRGQYGLHASLSWFDRALEIDPDHVVTLLERAATYGDLGRHRDMLADTRRALALAPGHPTAYYLQAVLAARGRDFALASALLQRTEGRFDQLPGGLLLGGIVDLETGNVERAIHRLQRLVSDQPHNRRARRILAAARWRAGDAPGTAEALRPIVDRPDADSYSLTLMGRALSRSGDARTAAHYLARAAQPARAATALVMSAPSDAEVAALRSAAAERPGDAPAQIALITALLGRGQGEEALDRARRLQAANPGAPDAHMLVGDALGLAGNFAGAAAEYRRAANIAFTEPVAMRMIEALRRSGQPAAADQVLSLFLQQNPRNVAAQLLLAARHMQAQNWAEAIRLYESLRARLGNNDATILNNLAWAYAESGDHDRALPLARHAWRLDPDNPATADTYGWLLFDSGRDRAAGLVLLERAARGAPTDAEIRRHLEAARRG